VSHKALTVCTKVERKAYNSEGNRFQTEVSVGRFSVELMAQDAIPSPVYVNIKKGPYPSPW
jgi:hypothetical protein